MIINELNLILGPAYRQLNMNDTHKADISLSFLTDGLCKLGLDDSREYFNTSCLNKSVNC